MDITPRLLQAWPERGIIARLGLWSSSASCSASDRMLCGHRWHQDHLAAWPRAFDARRALALGFNAEASFDDIIRIHVDDELGGRVPVLQ